MTGAPSPSSARFCSHCGHSILAGERFCGGCGVATDAASPVAPNYAAPAYVAPFQVHRCQACGDGSRLPAQQDYCAHCRWLRPLGSDYHLPIDYVMWDMDAAAMRALRNSGPVNAAAQAVSQRFGRPMLEAAVNGIRLGPDQMPEIFNQGILAARILGLNHMPEIYVSGEQMWDCTTLGDENGAFIVLGSVLLNFGESEILYLLGREMGHVAAGHALWNTVSRFMSGHSSQRTIMGDGVMQFINPAKIVESAIDAPLMAWSRQSQITADRAGALVVGSADIVRRVTVQWTMKSFPVIKRLNMEALERQVADSLGGARQIAEIALGNQPFLGRRLHLQAEFAATSDFQAWRRVIEHWIEAGKPKPVPAPITDTPPINDNLCRLTCIACAEPLRFDRTRFPNETDAIKVRCPNPDCRKVLEVRPAPPKSARIERLATEQEDNSVRIECVACSRPLRVLKAALAGRSEAKIRCPNTACGTILSVTPPPSPPAPPPDTLDD